MARANEQEVLFGQVPSEEATRQQIRVAFGLFPNLCCTPIIAALFANSATTHTFFASVADIIIFAFDTLLERRHEQQHHPLLNILGHQRHRLSMTPDHTALVLHEVPQPTKSATSMPRAHQVPQTRLLCRTERHTVHAAPGHLIQLTRRQSHLLLLQPLLRLALQWPRFRNVLLLLWRGHLVAQLLHRAVDGVLSDALGHRYDERTREAALDGREQRAVASLAVALDAAVGAVVDELELAGHNEIVASGVARRAAADRHVLGLALQEKL